MLKSFCDWRMHRTWFCSKISFLFFQFHWFLKSVGTWVSQVWENAFFIATAWISSIFVEFYKKLYMKTMRVKFFKALSWCYSMTLLIHSSMYHLYFTNEWFLWSSCTSRISLHWALYFLKHSLIASWNLLPYHYHHRHHHRILTFLQWAYYISMLLLHINYLTNDKMTHRYFVFIRKWHIFLRRLFRIHNAVSQVTILRTEYYWMLIMYIVIFVIVIYKLVENVEVDDWMLGYDQTTMNLLIDSNKR